MVSSHYTLVNNETEIKRLKAQAKLLYGGPHFIDKFISNGISVLDVGCGTGDIATYVAENIGDGRVSAIDIDRDKIESNIASKSFSNIIYDAGDVCSLKYADNSFDLTYARFLLMHLKNPYQALKEMTRVTKPGGTVVVHEGIHDGIWLTPRCQAFEHILREWKFLMEERGQDHSIGLRLHEMFYKINLKSANVEIMSHHATNSNNQLKLYMQNWLDHMPSLGQTLADKLNSRVFTEVEEALTSLGDGASYLEITAVGSGKKAT